MNDELLVVSVIAIVMGIIGLGVLLGKLDWTINLPGFDAKSGGGYNILRVRLCTGIMLIVQAILLPLGDVFFADNELLFSTILLLVTGLGCLMLFTWARRE